MIILIERDQLNYCYLIYILFKIIQICYDAKPII